MSRVLVVGGDGQIGRALVPVLKRAGHDVVATSRRRRWQVTRLDLAGWQGDLTAGFDGIVILAAVTGRAACAEDPDAAAAVNVAAPVRLAGPVLDRGGQVVFLSTHIVLGGDAPRLGTDAPYAPCDIYSEQKAEAERRLLALPGAAEGLAILRPTKVLDRSGGTVAGWLRQIRARQGFDAYTDLMMAPVETAHVCARIAALVADRAAGIHHVSGWPEISFADFAVRLGAALGWNQALIRRRAGRPVNPVAAASPPHASLDCPDPVPTDAVVQALVRPGRRGGIFGRSLNRAR